MADKPARIPIWASRKLHVARSLFNSAEQFWKSRIVGVLLIITSLSLVGYWHIYIPSPGKAVAALAVTAAIMTVRAEMTGIEKFLWMGVLFAFLFIEVRSIDKDRADNDKQQLDTRVKLDKNFAEVLRQNQTAFAATMGQMTGLKNLSRKNLCEVNGCDSFGYITITEPSTPVFVHVGQYPLYDVVARIVDMVKFKQVMSQNIHSKFFGAEIIIKPGDVQQGAAQIFRGVMLPISNEVKQDFNIFITARNGTWTELLRLRRVNGSWEDAIKVQQQVRSSGTNGKGRYRQMFEQITKHFPKEELRQDSDWNSK